jgi:hypothetical protein
MEYPELKTVNEVREYLQAQVNLVNDCYLDEDYLTPEFEIEEEGDWGVDFKYQYCIDIWKHVPTDTYWQINNSRSGSYHTDYYYNRPDFWQVNKTEKVVTKTVTEWSKV